MNIELFKTEKFSYVTLDEIYNEQELSYLWKEALFLCDENKLCPPEMSGSAFNDKGFIKNNLAVYISNDGVSNYSNLLSKPMKALLDNKQKLIEEDYTLNLYFSTNSISSLMSYYEDEHNYNSHYDCACYTYLFWLCKEPKQFIGGNFKFDDINEEIEFKNNFAILFPSWAKHSVEKVKFKGEKFQGLGRFCFSTFYNFK